MLSSAGLAAIRRVLTSSGAAAPWRQSTGVAARALVMRLAMPSVRTISVSAAMRSPAAKATAKPKTAAKKSTTKKSTTKKTAKPKAKKPVKKKVVKKKVAVKKPKKTIKKKKVLTPEEKERAEIRKLRQMALLKGPTLLPETAWNVYFVDNVRGSSGTAVDRAKTLAVSFKNLNEAEKERLASIGSSNKIANQETKRKWVQSFPPEAIYTANLARRRLSRKTDKTKTYLIHDDRLPHRAGSAFTLYLKEQFSQVGAAKATDAMRTIGEQWRSLSTSEKATYVNKVQELNKELGGQAKALREKGTKYWKEKLASPSA